MRKLHLTLFQHDVIEFAIHVDDGAQQRQFVSSSGSSVNVIP